MAFDWPWAKKAHPLARKLDGSTCGDSLCQTNTSMCGMPACHTAQNTACQWDGTTCSDGGGGGGGGGITCANVTDGTCTACTTTLASGCTAVTCDANHFNTNGDATDGCEDGCAVVDHSVSRTCDGTGANNIQTVECAAGYYQTGSANNDLSCTACAAGSVQPLTNQTSCTACAAGTYDDGSEVCADWTACDAGNYVSVAATATQDRTCTACSSESYRSSATAKADVNSTNTCAACAAGSITEIGVGTGVVSSAATTCTQCAAGTYSASSTSACTVCGAGQYSAIGATTCTNCDAGKFLTDNGVNKTLHDSSADCQVCANVQTYLGSTEGQATCNACGPGYGMTGSETPTAHIQCEGCQAPSVFNDNSDRSICGNATKCSPGEGYDVVLALPGDSTNTVQDTCANCPVGRYNGETDFSVCGLIGDGNRCDALLNAAGKSNTEVVNQLGCSSTTACLGNSGEYRAQANNENECRIASIGQQVQENDTPGGSYKASGASHTKDCEDGKFNLNGKNACEDVSAGKQGQTSNVVGGTHVSAGATYEVDCEDGKFNLDGTNACEDVSDGKQGQKTNAAGGVWTTTGALYEVDCEDGKFNLNGTNACEDVSAGKQGQKTNAAGSVWTTTGALYEIDCKEGFFNEDGTDACSAVGAGKQGQKANNDNVYTNIGAIYAVNCKAGTYNTNGHSECDNCPLGTYNEQLGQDAETDCQVCDSGKYVDVTGSDQASDCKDCPAGTHLDWAATFAERANHDNIDDCMVCNRGYYSTVVGSPTINDCQACAAGSYLTDNPDDQLQNDPTRSVHHDEESDCVVCAAGKYSTTVGAFVETTCVDCVAGTHLEHVPVFPYTAAQSALHDSDNDCQICPSGKWSGVVGSYDADNCTNCGVGKFLADNSVNANNHNEESDCLLCSAGNGNPLIAATGTWQGTPGSDSCDIIGKYQYCTAPLHVYSEHNGAGCSAVATKQCVCNLNGPNGAVGAECHFHGGDKCIAPCDSGHYLYIPKHYDDSLAASHEHRCVTRGSLPAAVSDAEIVNLYDSAVAVKTTLNNAGHRNKPASKMSFTSNSIEFTDARRDLTGTDKIANVLGARAVSNVITTALQPGEAVLVDVDFVGSPVKDEWFPNYKKTWRADTLLIRPTPKMIAGVSKTNGELTCAEDADVDLWPVPDYNYKVFLKYAGDRSLKCWDGSPKTLVTLISKNELGLNTYSAKCYKNGQWQTATRRCIGSGDLSSSLYEGDCFRCDFGQNLSPSEHRNYILSDTGNVDSATTCISADEKIQMADGRHLSARDIKVGDVLKTHNGQTTVQRIKSEFVEHRHLYEAECNGVTGRITGAHAFMCNGVWNHPQTNSRRLSELSRSPKEVLSFKTSNYCSDTIVLTSGLVVESWDGRSAHERRLHYYKDGRRLGCMNSN